MHNSSVYKQSSDSVLLEMDPTVCPTTTTTTTTATTIYYYYYYILLLLLLLLLFVSIAELSRQNVHYISGLCIFVCLSLFLCLVSFLLLTFASVGAVTRARVLAVPLRKCLGRHSCVSSTFFVAMLNGACFLRAAMTVESNS